MKNRGIFIILGIFFGMLGIHNFYAGHYGRGTAQLLISMFTGWLIIPLFLVEIWVIIELFTVKEDGNGNEFLK